MKRHNEKGFILALSVILVLVLGISGTAFMQLDYLERRMGMNEVDNHGSFYLANAGIERARETFKIETGAIPSWNSILDNDPATAPGYMLDDGSLSPHFAELCPVTPCVIPLFGDEVNASSASPLPFGGTFDDGHYEVRAFNDAAPLFGTEAPDTDVNGILIFRAIGHVRGEQKLLEAKVKAISGLDHLNCRQDNPTGPEEDCPDIESGSPIRSNIDGREPSSHINLPTIDYSFYRFDIQPTHFTQYSPGPLTFDSCAPTGSIDCSSNNITVNAASDTFYFIDKDTANLKILSAGTRNRVIIFGNVKSIEMAANHELTNIIVINEYPGGASPSEIQLKDGTIRAPIPYPAVISAGDVTLGNSTVKVYGNIFASGTINLNPNQVHGVMIAERIELQGSASTLYTDKDDLNKTPYYDLMPGFNYPPELKTTVVTAGGWQELE